MLLFGIEAESPGHELLSFECPQCQNIETRSTTRVGHISYGTNPYPAPYRWQLRHAEAVIRKCHDEMI